MFHSATYGNLELSQIPGKIKDYFNRMKIYDVPLQITVGTDSQNFDKTKIGNLIIPNAFFYYHFPLLFYYLTQIFLGICNERRLYKKSLIIYIISKINKLCLF